MSDAPYEKECLYCKNKIRMSKESGKWLPYDLNNGPHDCRNKKQETSTQAQVDPSIIQVETILQKMIDSAHAIIEDAERLKTRK
jgi:hypothetical protein